MTNPSPLRYPGGKAKFYPIISKILQINNLVNTTYLEPFAGGAGLALSLLFSEEVKKIILNDSDKHIYAFWYSVLNETEALCNLINDTSITIQQREIQKEIYRKCDMTDILSVGFATFFLNRTNVSGVLNGGVIGGKNQNGKYKMDVRYNKNSLINKIQKIASYRDRIRIMNYDVFDLFSNPSIRRFRNIFINYDPPYVNKGARLYQNYFTEENHRQLAQMILNEKRKWIVTYDQAPLILEIYKSCAIGFIDVAYTVREKKKVQEYIIFLPSLKVPKNITIINQGR